MVKRILLLVVALLGIWKTFGPYQAYWNRMTIGGANDFAWAYCAPHLIPGHNLYNWAAMDAEQDRIIPAVRKTGGPFPYVRLPYYAYLLWPLSQMPYKAAYYCWQLSALGSIIAFIFLWPTNKLPALVLCCWFFAVPYSFVNGQDVPFLLLFIGVSAYLVRRNADFAAGLVLSLCLSKFHLMLFVPLLLAASRRWRLASGFAAGGMLLVLVSFAPGGWTWPVEWYHAVNSPITNKNLSHSVVSLMSRHLNGPAYIGSVIILILAMAALVIYARRLDYPAGLGIALLAGTVVAFHVHSYDYMLLLPVLSLAVSLSCNPEPVNGAAGAMTAIPLADARGSDPSDDRKGAAAQLRKKLSGRGTSLLALGIVVIAGLLMTSRAYGYDLTLLLPVGAMIVARMSPPAARLPVPESSAAGAGLAG